ncbi:MAG: hypothetical protein IPK19_28925 [Chloroflexi bacterium]|nr:hypothetical protein [Chloroflexota bacterium]
MINHWPGRWISLLAVCLVFALSLPVAAQDAPSEIPPTLVEQMMGLEAATIALRGLQPTFEIDRAFPTRADTIAYLEDLFSRELPQDQLDRSEDFYVVLNLLPADIDLGQVYLDLLSSQVAGFYDTDTQTMNVIPMMGDDPGGKLSLLEQTIYVHEYTHALQDMNFDLDSLRTDDISNNRPDQSLAITALIEGDATAVMQVYLQEAASSNPLAALSMLAESAAAGALLPPAGIPDILTRELLLPYEEGLNFVLGVWNDGGWEAIDAAFVNLPTTTEQILHPEKYLAGEGAIPVDLSALDPGEGWAPVWDTTLGEFYLLEHVASLAEFRTAAVRATTGWGGDSFRVWRNGDQLASVLEIVFDTPEDTAEFVEVYGEATEAFAPECAAYLNGVLCAVERDGAVRIVAAPDAGMAASLLG